MTVLGESELDGEKVQGYSAVLDPRRYAEVTSGEWSAERIVKVFGEDGLRMDAWIDADGLPRRMVYVARYVPNDEVPDWEGGTYHQEIQFSGWGAKVEIRLPDPALAD